MILGLKTKIKKTIKKEKGAMSSSSNSKRVLFHCKNYIFRNLDFRRHMMVGWKIVAISDIWSSGQLLIKFMYISFIFLISVTVCLLGQSQPNSPSAQCNEKTNSPSAQCNEKTASFFFSFLSLTLFVSRMQP